MKRCFLFFCMFVLSLQFCFAQSPLNAKADNIVGEYVGLQGEDHFKVRFTHEADGYKAQIIWMEHMVLEDGCPCRDVKNPDKKLRNTPCDKIVLIQGLKYDKEKQHWSGAKIYDPQRGLRAHVTCEFTKDGRLKLRGTVLGIGESVYWKKVK